MSPKVSRSKECVHASGGGWMGSANRIAILFGDVFSLLLQTSLVGTRNLRQSLYIDLGLLRDICAPSTIRILYMSDN